MSYVIGYTTPGGGGIAPGQADRAWVGKVTSSAAGTIASGTVTFVSSTASGASGKMIVLSVTAGEPDAVLYVSDALAIPAGASTQTFTFSGSPSIAASTDYYIGIVNNDFQAEMDQTENLGASFSRLANGTFSYATPPGTWPGTDSSSADRQLTASLTIDTGGGFSYLLVKN